MGVYYGGSFLGFQFADLIRGDNYNFITGFGAESSDTMYGYGNDDTIYGYGQNDYISGGDDNDYLYGGDEDDQIDGGSGNDKIYGNDTIDDAADDHDYLDGGSGNDTIYGQDGNDTIGGGSGNDYVEAGDGNDLIVAYYISTDANTLWTNDTGSDTLKGGSGNDTIHGDEGDDTIYGDGGSDSIEGYGSRDTIYGGSDNDYINGGDDHDVLIGEEGDDTIYGGEGNDYIEGGDSNDFIVPGDGNDRIDGGSKSSDYDIVQVSGNADFTITDSSIIGEDTDTIYNIDQVEVVAGNSANTLDASSFSDDVILEGGQGNDTLIGSQGESTAVFNGLIANFTLTENSDGTWTVTDNNGSEGTDKLTDIDYINFTEDKVNTIFNTSTYSTTVTAIASNEGDDYEISGGDNGPTQYIIGLEGTTETTLSFNTELLGDFVNAITLPDQSVEDQRLFTNILLDIAGDVVSELVPGVSTAYSIASELANYSYDLEQIELQYAATETVLQDANYSPESWIDYSSPTRDVITITDFQIGVDTIVLPSVEADSTVYYEVTTNNNGAIVKIDFQGSEAEQFLIVENNYSELSNDEFQEVILDLIAEQSGSYYNGATISAYKQTQQSVSAQASGQIYYEGSYANDWIYGEEHNSSDYQGLNGSFELEGLWGDDLIQGNKGNDLLYGGFNSVYEDIPTYSAFTYEDDGHDLLQGNDGDDTLHGGSGNDTLDGGSGNDTASYSGDTDGIWINLATSEVTDGFGYTDTLVDIENIEGSDYYDYFEVSDLDSDAELPSISTGESEDGIFIRDAVEVSNSGSYTLESSVGYYLGLVETEAEDALAGIVDQAFSITDFDTSKDIIVIDISTMGYSEDSIGIMDTEDGALIYATTSSVSMSGSSSNLSYEYSSVAIAELQGFSSSDITLNSLDSRIFTLEGLFSS